MKHEIRTGEWMSKGFDVYKQNLGVLIPAALVAVVLSVVTVGILAGPIAAGLAIIALHLVDKEETKPDVSTLFQGFNFFLQTFLCVLVWGAIGFVAAALLGMVICVGQIASILLGLALGTGLMFALFFIVDQKSDFWPASMESIAIARENFFPLLGFYVVASLIGALGSILCGIGMVITLPITVCMFAVAYRDLLGTSAADPTQGETPPPTPSPEPAKDFRAEPVEPATPSAPAAAPPGTEDAERTA